MKSKLHYYFRVSLILVTAVMFVGAGILGTSHPALAAAPAHVPANIALAPRHQVTALPGTTCSLVGSTRTCELWATTGSLSLPDGSTVDIWGYSDTEGGAAQLPGPALIVNEGEAVDIILHNTLPFTTSLNVPGQDLLLDLVGIAPGGVQTYSFTASNVGTYAYEAGLADTGTDPDGARQVTMGLFGAFIVRPAGQPTWAYGDASSAFDDEVLLVFNEIDPSFNADPAAFIMTDFQPTFWLINGKAYSQTDPIPTVPGNKVLLRYLNAGVQARSIGLLGLRQTVLGSDSSGLPATNQYSVVAETIGAGASLDTLTEIPLTVTVGTKYPLYNTSFQQDHNNGALSGSSVGFGGIITFLDVSGGTPVPDTGPLASDVVVSPNPTNGMSDVTLSAILDESTTGGSSIAAAEYFTETLGLDGTGTPISITVDATMVTVNAIIPSATLETWEPGDITFYIHGQDALGNWGPVNSDVLDLVKVGPAIWGMVLTPNPTNGSADVGIQATADTTVSGGVNVTQAEFFIDTPGDNGTGTPMDLNIVAPVSSLTASLPSATVDALSEGEHNIFIHAQDELGNWGAFESIALRVDKTGPLATGNSLGPNPNNGTLPINSSTYAVRLEASFIDGGSVSSALAQAEVFIDTIEADGTGIPLMARDAIFDGSNETAYADVPLATINFLSEGIHTFYFHAKDVAGNWGNYGSLDLIIDKTRPVTSNVYAVPPNPRPGVTNITLFGTVQDPDGLAPASSIVAAEWFIGRDPGIGFGSPMTAVDGAFNSPQEDVTVVIDISGLRNGTYTLWVRGKDQAGNWSDAVSTRIIIRGNGPANILVDGFEAANLAGWSQTVGAVSVTSAAVMDGGSYGMQAVVNGATPGYLVDQTPIAETIYSAFFTFNPNGFDTQGNEVNIFVGRDTAGISIFGIQYERSAGEAELRGWVLSDGSPVYTAWYQISDAPQKIQLAWESKDGATFTLYMNGVIVETLTDLNTAAYTTEEIRLGPSSGLTADMSGTLYFDDFASWRMASMFYIFYIPNLSK